MKELRKIYEETGQEFINDLLNDYVVVTEKLSGSSFAFEDMKGGLTFFKGTSQKPINLIDRTIMVYYEPAINYIKKKVKNINIPKNWMFCFQYFVHNEPGVIKYTNVPKNNLVLTHIHVKNESGKTAKVIDDPRVIGDWAQKLDVTAVKPFFMGYLNEDQKTKIKEFVSIPIEDQEELFGTSSFVEYLLSVLNPDVKATTLHGDLKNPIDSLVFKFVKAGDGKSISARIIDPYTRTLMKEKEPIDIRRAPADINEIVLLDLLAFIEERGINKADTIKQDAEERYIDLISLLFNEYVAKNSSSLEGIKFNKAEFANADEFDLNVGMIQNKQTRELVSSSDGLKDLYKVMLGSLRKKRNPDKSGAVLTPSVIEDFNKMVDKINKISGSSETKEFKTFNDYLEMKKVTESVEEDPIESVTEEKVLSFNDFIALDKVNVNVNEALNVPYKERGKKPVNIIVGRFQPFTKGHVKVFEQLHKQNGYPVVVFTVRGKKPNPEKSPFGENEQQTMFNKMKKQYPFLEAMYTVPNAAIDTLYSTVRPAYEPMLWGFGTDRKKGYESMIHKPEYREQLDAHPDFTGYEIKRGDEDISASKVRNAIELDDESTFKKMTPKSIHDMYPILQDVLVPVTESYDEDDDEPIYEAKETDFSGEAKAPGTMHLNKYLIPMVEKAGKLKEYKEFSKNIPRGVITDLFISFLNNLNEPQTKELVSQLASLSKPEQLTTKMLYNRNTPIGKLYNIESRGTGKAELAIAWLIKGAQIQGGSESYDVNINGKHFEVKNYSKKTQKRAAILAGVKSKVTNFEFWKEIVDTIRRLDKLTGYSSGVPKFDYTKYFDDKFVSTVREILDNQGTILSGEMGKSKIKLFQSFYEQANSVESSIKGYSNVILRGPHVKPLELSIVPISSDESKGETFQVTKAKKDQSLTYILSELRRLKYVRDPKAFMGDMQKEVDNITSNVTYIVFRHDSINLVPTGDFKPSAISISSLKFIEKYL